MAYLPKLTSRYYDAIFSMVTAACPCAILHAGCCRYRTKFVEQNTKNPLVPFLGAGEFPTYIPSRFLPYKFQRSLNRFIGVFFKFFHGGVADILVKFVFRNHGK
ncbi:MAG: hypothetical protein ACLS4Z_11565 [Christensenellaceae bacterium]